MKIFTLILFSLFVSLTIQAQLRVGDPGVTFDASKLDPDYEFQMLEWQKAGVEGGIPFLSDTPVHTTLTPNGTSTNTTQINIAIFNASQAGGLQQIVLNDGIYPISEIVNMRNNVRLVGESRDGVKIIVMNTSGDAIRFNNVTNAGLDNLTIEGGFGVPNDFSMTEAKSEFFSTSVGIGNGSKNCWLDGVTILNSGRHPLNVSSNNNTIRSCYIERCWNKDGGFQGYFQVSGKYNLVYDTTVKKIRHFALQNTSCEFNVVYQNNLEQDINFHNRDNGNNLVEQNISRLPIGLPDRPIGASSPWHSIMSFWSSQHDRSSNDNYIFNNDCREDNNQGRISFSDPTKVYVGTKRHENTGTPFDFNNNTPTGGTFYPIVLNSVLSVDDITNNTTKAAMFPNPATDFVTLSNVKKGTTIEIFSITGSKVIDITATTSEETITTSQLTSGIYLILIDGKTTLKLVKK